MLNRFLPKQTDFFDFFDQHAVLVVQGAEYFQTMAAHGGEIRETVQQIKEVEHRADLVTQQCIESLHKTFITPFDRESIYALISKLDDIIDETDAAAECLAIYKLTEMTQAAIDFAKILLLATQGVARVVYALRNLKHGEAIQRECVNLHYLENQSDEIYRNAVGTLFDHEDDVKMIIKWKEIYEHLENAMDRCEDVANIVDGILMEHD